jgi:hypothetical protein
VHVPDKQRSKLGAKSLTCTFLSYAQNRGTYRLVHHPSRHFLESRDVIFEEGGTEKRYERIILEPATAESGSAAEGSPPATNVAPDPKDTSDSESEQEIEGLLTSPPDPAQAAPPTSCPKRTTRAPIQDDDPRYAVSSYGKRKHSEHAKSAQLEDADPRTYKEAMSRPNAAVSQNSERVYNQSRL